jgi:hypothetical protein
MQGQAITNVVRQQQTTLLTTRDENNRKTNRNEGPGELWATALKSVADCLCHENEPLTQNEVSIYARDTSSRQGAMTHYIMANVKGEQLAWVRELRATGKHTGITASSIAYGTVRILLWLWPHQKLLKEGNKALIFTHTGTTDNMFFGRKVGCSRTKIYIHERRPKDPNKYIWRILCAQPNIIDSSARHWLCTYLPNCEPWSRCYEYELLMLITSHWPVYYLHSIWTNQIGSSVISTSIIVLARHFF